MSSSAQVTLELTDVNKRLGANPVLRGVSLSLTAGAVVAILGANGSGKSTLLRLISGQIQPDSGTIRVCGKSLGWLGPDARSHLGYVPDYSEAFLDLTGMEFVRLCYGLRQVKRGAVEVQHELAWDIDAFAGRRLRALSFGQRKRLCLIASLAGDPDVWLLDEPTNGLDQAGADYLTNVVCARRRQGKITLAATHDASVLAAWEPQISELLDGNLGRLSAQ